MEAKELRIGNFIKNGSSIEIVSEILVDNEVRLGFIKSEVDLNDCNGIKITEPFFFKMRADMLVTADFERRVISDRSKFGVRSAKLQGRFIGVAPFGYKNARDQDDKPIIIINNDLAPPMGTKLNHFCK